MHDYAKVLPQTPFWHMHVVDHQLNSCHRQCTAPTWPGMGILVAEDNVLKKWPRLWGCFKCSYFSLSLRTSCFSFSLICWSLRTAITPHLPILDCLSSCPAIWNYSLSDTQPPNTISVWPWSFIWLWIVLLLPMFLISESLFYLFL